MKKISLVLALLMLFSFVAMPSTKAAYMTLEQEMEIAKRRLRENKGALANETKRSSLLNKQFQDKQNHLLEIRTEINSIYTEIARIENEILKTNQDIYATRKSLSEIGSRVDLKRERVNGLLGFINEISGKRFIDFIFSAENFSDLTNRNNTINKLLEAFIHALNDLRIESFEEIKHRGELENSEIRLKELKLNLEKELNDITLLQNKTEEVIKSIQTEMGQSQAKKDKLKSELDKWDSEIDKIFKSIKKRDESLRTNGKFAWPVDGYLSSDYGPRKHPILGDNRMHTGIDIHADMGTPIRAAGKGKVYHLGWLGYYGHVVAIDHGRDDSGKHYKTLYAHLSRYATKLNTNVKEGQIIGYIGTSGRSTGPHLHFEVRVNGSYVDPKGYLKKIVRRYTMELIESFAKAYS